MENKDPRPEEQSSLSNPSSGSAEQSSSAAFTTSARGARGGPRGQGGGSSGPTKQTSKRQIPKGGESPDDDDSDDSSQRDFPSFVDEVRRCVVAIYSSELGQRPVGLGCVTKRNQVLTSRWVVEQAVGPARAVTPGEAISVSLPGLQGVEKLWMEVVRADYAGPTGGLALLESRSDLVGLEDFCEFATVLDLSGKEFSLSSVDTHGNLVAPVRGRFPKFIEGVAPLVVTQDNRALMFGGGPVWSPELNAFVGLVAGVREEVIVDASVLSQFVPSLPVKFRVPPSDRPKLKDRSKDDPNVKLFGSVTEANGRRLSARKSRNPNNTWHVRMTYEVLQDALPARGKFVTFLTYPNMGADYEIISVIGNMSKVVMSCEPLFSDFTIAAVGDAGDTRLTFDLNLAEVVDSEEESEAYRPTYPLYLSDQAPYANRRQRFVLTDALRNRAYAQQMAKLICAKLTPMPLSLGLFGDWGSGKSYFIGLLHKEIEDLTKKADKAFHRKVVQIHFNAWHYLDTNLWANLVCEIFDNLFHELVAREDTPNEKVAELKKQLAEESALAAEARKALEDAKTARKEAETKLVAASQKREEQERTVAVFLDDLKDVAKDVVTQEGVTLYKLASSFGLERLKESYGELEARVTEARTLSGRFKSLGLVLLSPEGRGKRLALLGVALLLPLVLGVGMAWLMNWLKPELTTNAGSITAVVTLLGSIATWISKQTDRGAKLIDQLESAYARVNQLRKERREKKGPPREEVDLAKYMREETEAQQALNEAQIKVRAIESELRELAPGRRLLKFLERRAGANDYRQHLGLISLVRRDFEKLSELVHDGNEPTEETPGEPPVLNRIVLYIDDLDRCKPERVVAVLEAVHLLLAFPIFAVVVAVDPRWLRKSLVEHYPTLLNGARNNNGDPLGDEGGLASPQDYLEKIFQVPFQLEPIGEKGVSNLAKELLPVEKQAAKTKDGAKAEKGEEYQGGLATNESDRVRQEITERQGRQAGDQENRQSENVEPNDPSRTEKIAKGPAEIPEPPAEEVAERLQLKEWERAAIEQCYRLFRTPRAVKRLANTYCLIRTGVTEGWGSFIGTEKNPIGGYRAPLLMLAVAAGYPALARQWFDGLASSSSWIPSKRQTENSENKQWESLVDALDKMKANEFAPFDQERVRKWVTEVRRYAF